MTEQYIMGDWRDLRHPLRSVDLAILDPVYGENIDSCLTSVFGWLKNGGSLYVFGDASSIASIKVFFDLIPGWTFQNWLIWGPNDWGGRSHRRWGQKHDDILFYTKQGADHYFDADAVAVPKKMTQEVFNPSGRTTKIPNSVWSDLGGFSTMSKERIKVNGQCVRWQKPERLIERIVKASCPPGGLVLDPFSGVATVPVVCKRLGRSFIATEIDPVIHAAGSKRLGNG